MSKSNAKVWEVSTDPEELREAWIQFFSSWTF